MMRVMLHILIAFILSIIETSLFASFHGMIRFTPFVFAVSVYLLQHHGISSAASWMVLHGIFLDILQHSQTPFITLAYLVAAFISVLSAQRVFSNRSVYGIVTCALLSYTGFTIIDLILRLSGAFISKYPFNWFVYLQDTEARYLTLIAFLVILFIFAKRIRVVLAKLFLIPQSRQTL